MKLSCFYRKHPHKKIKQKLKKKKNTPLLISLKNVNFFKPSLYNRRIDLEAVMNSSHIINLQLFHFIQGLNYIIFLM